MYNLRHSDASSLADSESESTFSDTEQMDAADPPDCEQLGNSSSDELFDFIYRSSKFTMAEFLLDVCRLFKIFKISKNCVVAVLKLFQKYLPTGNRVPKSKKAFMNIINKITPHIQSTVKYFCVLCGSYVGQTCPKKCIQTTCKSKQFSISLENNVKDMLRYFFEKRNLVDKIDEHDLSKTNDSNKIRDLEDGENCKAATKVSKYDINFVLNTDGFPMGNSTTMQIWPCFLAISNIHHKLRPSYLMLTNIYCGPCKPHFDYFLEGCLTQLTEIGSEGFEWVNPKNNEIEHSKAYVTVCAVDAQARAPLQNVAYYNGAYGCTFCEIKSEPINETSDQTLQDDSAKEHVSNTCYYPYNLSLEAPLRTKENIMKYAAEMVDPIKAGQREKGVKHIKGVKGFSCLAFLPYFDSAGGFSPDFLHSCLLGVVRRHLNNLFSSKYKQKEFYFTAGIRKLISNRLVQIKPPNIVTRLPRSLKYLKQWKGSEFYWWLLFYALPCLDKTFRNSTYFEHFMLLVRAIHLLLDDEISDEDIEYSKTLLNMFCASYGELYDPQEETFNLHILLHYADSVKKCGPLWATSSMIFEGANNFLKNSIHGSNSVAQELHNTAKIYSAIDALEILCNEQSKITNGLSSVMLGFKKPLDSLPIEIRDYIASLPSFTNSLDTSIYERARVGGLTYTTAFYTRAKKTCSFYALVDNTFHGEKKIEFVKLMAFVHTSQGRTFIGKVVKVFGPAYKSARFGVDVKHIRISLDTHTLVSSSIDNIVKPLFKIEDKICIPPKIWCTSM